MGRKGYGTDVKLRAKVLWMMGNHTDQHIADVLSIPRSETIGEWRRADNWEREKQLVQEEADRRVSQAMSETISEMNARHLKEFQLLQSKGITALKKLDPRNAGEALSMIDTGVRGERLVRGEPTEVREVRALMQANVQVLELVVADVLKVLIDGGRIDRSVARQFADEFAAKVNDAPFRYAVEG